MFRITKLMSIPVALSLLVGAATVSAQAASPVVGIQLLSSGLTSPLVASSTNATVARLVLDTSGNSEGVRIASLPFILTTGNGAVASTLTNCRAVNENTGADLSIAPGNGVSLVGGLNSISLNPSLVLNPGTITTVDLRCDPSAGLVNGGNFTFSMNTANVAGTGVNTGLPAVITIRGASPVPPVIIPTVPNTGAGGQAPLNIALLLGSVMLAVAGVAYTRKAVAAEVR